MHGSGTLYLPPRAVIDSFGGVLLVPALIAYVVWCDWVHFRHLFRLVSLVYYMRLGTILWRKFLKNGVFIPFTYGGGQSYAIVGMETAFDLGAIHVGTFWLWIMCSSFRMHPTGVLSPCCFGLLKKPPATRHHHFSFSGSGFSAKSMTARSLFQSMMSYLPLLWIMSLW